MTDLAPDKLRPHPKRNIGSQPIFLGLSALVLVAVGLGSIGAWRAYTGSSPEQDRVTSARLLQTRTAQIAEELADKTKGLEQSQQETIDQVQTTAEQVLILKRLLTAQQAETKRLSEQIGGVAEAVDGLRRSFATARDTEVATPRAKRRPVRLLPRSAKLHIKKPKSKSRS